MALRSYFCMVSWQDPNQPISRTHENVTTDLDLTLDAFKVRQAVEILMHRNLGNVDCFTIDFMIPTGDD